MIHIEKITLTTATETYTGKLNITALDYIMPALEHLEYECKLLDYDSISGSLTFPDNENPIAPTEEEDWKSKILALVTGMTQEQAEFLDHAVNNTFDTILRNSGEFEPDN